MTFSVPYASTTVFLDWNPLPNFEWPSARIKRKIGVEKFEEARRHYTLDANQSLDQSDFWMSFEFAIDTYGSVCWRHYFGDENLA